MVEEQDGSGLTICDVLDQRLTLATVVTMDGAEMTVDIPRTFPLHAIPLCLRTVSDNSSNKFSSIFSYLSLIDG